MVKFTWESLGALCVALMAHAERLNSLLKPSWPDAEKVQEEMYDMVDTLMVHAVDQKRFSTFCLNWGGGGDGDNSGDSCGELGQFVLYSAIPFKNFMSSLPQATGYALISCIHAAHTKYESNPLDWQQIIEIGWRLLAKQDMERFEEMCKDGLLGGSNYVIFEDWSAIDRSRDGISVLGMGWFWRERFRR